MRDVNGKPFIATLYNVLFAPYLWDQLFSIITVMNLGHTFLYHEGFWTVLYVDNEHNAVTLLQSAQEKHAFLVKIKEKWKPEKQVPKNNSPEIISLEIRKQVKKVTTVQICCKCLVRNWNQVRSWTFMHIISDIYNK